MAQDDVDTHVAPQTPTGANLLYMPALKGDASKQPGAIVPGEYIVVLKDSSNERQVESSAAFANRIAAQYGGTVLFTYDSVLNGFAIAMSADAATAVAAEPDVDYVEPNTVVTADTSQIGATWGLDRIDQRNRPLNTVYGYGPNGTGVHAYIIDTGIRGTHTQFTGRMGAGYTAIVDGNGTNDCNGHGTHVAGTVGGTTYGVAKRVILHPIRVLGCTGSGTTAGVIAGVNWVANNKVKPAVANMSLGGGVSASLDSAVNNAISKGIVVVVAAGNSNVSACTSSPARVPNAVTVGATTNWDARASFSNYGTCLDIFAPGQDITSAWYTGNSVLNTISGTSMAAPHVAGAAALYLDLNNAATPASVRNALVNNATLNKVTNPGVGSPNKLLYTGFMGGAPGACTNLLANPGFDSGPGSWTQSSTHSWQLICTNGSCGSTINPRTANYLAWLGGGNSETSQIRQNVALPVGKSARLVFFYYVGSSDTCNHDYGYARVIVNGVTRNLKTVNLCAANNTNGWVSAQYDLTAYAGKTVTVLFRAVTNASLSSNFFIDDTRLISGACTELDALESPVELPEEQPLPSEDYDLKVDPNTSEPQGPVDVKQF
ncbi:MAG: S8 family serine peptidase [Anaerolineales bacterium]|nr:S8 family serine peptidase [Anaerolineales bacterium]